eukprot:Lithocolla_globosa_v1_NODE_3295_length_1708_cov_22.649123.p5 type:complete len:107 gc:universal NODE_3295_length_1708_cov_22.649123:335-15(-)
MGVRESQPSSLSMFRLERLSTITTSWPWSLRYRDVGQPQNPSPPRTMTFFFSASPLAPLTAYKVVVVAATLDGFTTFAKGAVKEVTTVTSEVSRRTLILFTLFSEF